MGEDLLSAPLKHGTKDICTEVDLSTGMKRVQALATEIKQAEIAHYNCMQQFNQMNTPLSNKILTPIQTPSSLQWNSAHWQKSIQENSIEQKILPQATNQQSLDFFGFYPQPLTGTDP